MNLIAGKENLVKREKSSTVKHRALLIQVLCCAAIAWLFLYLYIDKQNELTEIRMEIPLLTKQVRALQEENARLEYEIDQVENPVRLIELSQKPEFSHLQPAYRDAIDLLPR